MPTLRNVGIELQHSQKSMMIGLARKLRAEFGARIHAYVRSENELAGIVREFPSPPWDTIGISEVMSGAVLEEPPPLDQVIQRARDFEARIGESLNRIILAKRHFNRGYSPGSFRHVRSPRYANASYHAILHGLNEQLAFWDREIHDKQLDLIIDGDKAAACIARANGVAFRWYCFGRYKGHRAWATDEYQSNPLIKPAYDALTSWGPPQLSDAYDAARTKNREFYERFTPRRMFTKNVRALGRYGYWRIARPDLARSIDVADLFRGPFRMRRSIAQLNRIATTTLSDLEERPFAYLPLQKEPEVALLQAAPTHTNQQAVVMAASRELPAGVTLAVKEHTIAISRRPPTFYEQIAALPNVRWVSPAEDPIALVRTAAVTLTVAGTAAHEAAVLGRPAIVFGQHVHCNFLPHVMTVSAEGDLRRYLCRVFDGEVDLERARDDGARYEAAVAAATFDIGNASAWVTEMGRGAVEQSAIDNAFEWLMRTFELEAPEFDREAVSAVRIR